MPPAAAQKYPATISPAVIQLCCRTITRPSHSDSSTSESVEWRVLVRRPVGSFSTSNRMRATCGPLSRFTLSPASAWSSVSSRPRASSKRARWASSTPRSSATPARSIASSTASSGRSMRS